MSTDRVAAVDIGASSGRVVVAELSGESIALDEVARFPNGPVQREGRWVWDAQELHRQIAAGLDVAASCGATSFGIDTWACDYGVVDDDGRSIGPVFAYRDPRHGDGRRRVRERIAWADHYAVAGIQDLVFNTVNQLVDDPRLGDGVCVMQVPDLLGFWLSGVRASDVTNASTTALVDPRTRQWSASLVDAVGIPPSVLLPLSEPGTMRGQLSSGLQFVGVGTHDTASAFAGAPIGDREAALIVSLGTWALVGYESVDAVPSAESLALDVTHELGVDGTVRVLRNVSGMWLFEECRRTWTDGEPPSVTDLIAAMEAATPFAAAFDIDEPALATPGQSPTSIEPFLDRAWDGSRGAVVRAILESLVARLAVRIRELEELSGRPRPQVHVVGGASRIASLMQWLADATGKTVIAGPTEATAIGNAVVQFASTGVLRDLAQARSFIGALPEVRTFEPMGSSAPWEAFTARIEEGRRHG